MKRRTQKGRKARAWRNPTAPTVTVFPVSPMALRWAADWIHLRKEAENYEAALQAGKASEDQRGLPEELASISPPPGLGILGPETEQLVEQLDIKTRRSWNGLGYPVEEVASVGNTHIFLAAMGRLDDPNGMMLAPDAWNTENSVRAAAGIVRGMLLYLWDYDRHGWKPDAMLNFALPLPYYDGDEVELTGGERILNAVSPKWLSYAGDGNRVLASFSSNGRVVVGAWIDEEGQKHALGGQADKIGSSFYLVRLGTSSGSLEINDDVLILRVEGREHRLNFVKVDRVLPPNRVDPSIRVDPPIVSWLKSGVNMLGQSAQRRSETTDPDNVSTLKLVSHVAGKSVTASEVERCLLELRTALDQLPIGFAEPLPVEAYYGGPPIARKLANKLFSSRVRLGGARKGKVIPSLTAIQAAGGAGSRAAGSLREMMFKGVGDFNEVEADQWDKETWLLAENRTYTGQPFPLDDPNGPIKVAMFTLYGVPLEGGEYRVLAQSPPMTGVQIAGIVQQARREFGETRDITVNVNDEEQTLTLVLKPVMALRAWLVRHFGLHAQAAQWAQREENGEPLPIPYAIIGSVIVNAKKATKDKLFKPAPIGADGLYVAQIPIQLSNKSLLPEPSMLDAVHGAEEASESFELARVALVDMLPLSMYFARINVTRTPGLFPMGGTLFGLATVRQTEKWRYVVKKLAEKMECSVEEVPEHLIYAATITSGLLPGASRAGGAKLVRAGRAAHEAAGGRKGRVVMRGGEATHPDAPMRVHATSSAYKWKPTVFNFAMDIIKTAAAKPVRVGKSDAAQHRADEQYNWRSSVTQFVQGKEDSPVEQEMLKYGIELPDPSDRQAVRAALLQLREALQHEYRHQTRTGLIPAQLQEAAVAPKTEAEMKGIAAFATEYLDEIARLNRGRRRRPTRRNPLDQDGVNDAVSYVTGKAKEKPEVRERLDRAFAQLGDEPAGWSASRESVGEFFPARGDKAEVWTPERRFETLLRLPIVARVAGLDPNDQVVQRGRAATEPFGAESRALLAKAAGLSLDDVSGMLGLQRDTRPHRGSKRQAMQPSSAYCRSRRRRKLPYVPPRPMRDVPAQTLIMMSPEGTQARVMTFRQGAHIDCDLIGQSLPELLGQALRGTLLWLAEKPRRARGPVYVGRVGQGDLTLAWQPGQDLSIDQVSVNLGNATSRQQVYTDGGVQTKDIELYMKGLSMLKKMRVAAGSPSVDPDLPPVWSGEQEKTSPGFTEYVEGEGESEGEGEASPIFGVDF